MASILPARVGRGGTARGQHTPPPAGPANRRAAEHLSHIARRGRPLEPDRGQRGAGCRPSAGTAVSDGSVARIRLILSPNGIYAGSYVHCIQGIETGIEIVNKALKHMSLQDMWDYSRLCRA